MRKSSPSFCQDTPDKESRRHWEVIMIVLTGGKDASIAYCLTTALYCPLPGQYLAIARHKTIRRERKSPLSFLLFTLHQIVWNPDKHRGSERWRVAHHSSPLFTHSSPGYSYSSDYAELTEHSCSTDYAQNWNGSSTYSVCRITQIFQVKSGWRVVVSGSGWRVVKSGEESSALFTLPKQLIHKHLRHSGEGWRVLLKVACIFPISSGFYRLAYGENLYLIILWFQLMQLLMG